MIFRLEKACSDSKGNKSRLKLDIFNPKMLHNCPHALGDNSNPIDGIEWSLSTGLSIKNGLLAYGAIPKTTLQLIEYARNVSAHFPSSNDINSLIVPVLRSHRSLSMAIAVPWGPSMAINGPSMGIDEVFLTLIPSMGHRWTIDDPSMEIEIFHHKYSFDLAMFKIFTKLTI